MPKGEPTPEDEELFAQVEGLLRTLDRGELLPTIRDLHEWRALRVIDYTPGPSLGQGRGRAPGTYGPDAARQVVEVATSLDPRTGRRDMALVVLRAFGAGRRPQEKALRRAYHKVLGRWNDKVSRWSAEVTANPRRLVRLTEDFAQDVRRVSPLMANTFASEARSMARGTPEEKLSSRQHRENTFDHLLYAMAEGQPLDAGRLGTYLRLLGAKDGQLPDGSDMFDGAVDVIPTVPIILQAVDAATYEELEGARNKFRQLLSMSAAIAAAQLPFQLPPILGEFVGRFASDLRVALAAPIVLQRSIAEETGGNEEMTG